MDTISFEDKSTGQQLTAADVNEIKEVVNTNAADRYGVVNIPIQNVYKKPSYEPTTEIYRNGVVYKFDTNDTVYFTIQLPPSYKVGTDVSIYLHCMVSGEITEGNSYEPEFELTFNVAEVGDEFNAVAGSNPASKVLEGFISEDAHIHFYMGIIDSTYYPMGINSLILCRLELLDKDGYSGTINLLSISAYFLNDSIGSETATTK